MTAIPRDPAILLSFINTRLRDCYPDIEELCKALSLDRGELEDRLRAAGYEYDRERNQYV